MNPRRTGRTQQCGRNDARTRMRQARAFLEVAELVSGETDELATTDVCAALAVLSGIAASDAACCAAVGRRSRGQDHNQALALLGEVEPDGKDMARDLRRLLAIKDDAHYGLLHVSTQRAASALRQAQRLLTAARTHVE